MSRGSALVAVLLVVAVMFVLGIAMLTRQVYAYRGVGQAREGAVALALAEAGLEDARIKLEKDLLFPVPSAPDQRTFSYAEELTDEGGRRLGSYTVTVDQSYAGMPYCLLRITSVGSAGERGQPGARRTLRAEVDVAPCRRTDRTQPNPDIYRIIRVAPGDD